MAKCSSCGKRGLFLMLSKDGLCEKCEARCEAERKRKAQEELYLQKQEEEKQRKAQEELYLQKQEEKAEKEYAAIKSLPSFEIRCDGKKMSSQPINFLDELKYSSATPKSTPEKFKDFVVLDIETTGLSSSRNKVIEIAAIKVRDFEFRETFHTYIRPFKTSTFENAAKQINGIPEDLLMEAPYVYEVIPSLQDFISGENLLGHNLEFDLKFLCRAGLDVTSEKRLFFDTMKLGQRFLKRPRKKWDKEYEEYVIDYDSYYDVEDHKLDTLCSYYQIWRMDKHRALGDCIDTAKLFRTLLEEKIDTKL
jgi:DNA polymerase III epsilon subunit family exonuclease